MNEKIPPELLLPLDQEHDAMKMDVERARFARRPQNDTHVFFRVIEGSTIEAEDVEGETHLVTLGAGDQILMRYAPVAKLLFTKSIYLV